MRIGKNGLWSIVLGSAMAAIPLSAVSGNYNNFAVAVYVRAYEVRQMADAARLDSVWTEIARRVKVDKVYLETYRDQILVDETTIEKAKNYFERHGVKVAGGITFTVSEPNRYETFCYTNPEHRNKVKGIAEYTAKHFDEIILDDFFFTDCKCELCIKAKGGLSWTEYRLKLMEDAARSLVIDPARKINPRVKIVIKYPNWYDHFQGLGFNLEAGPKQFDGIYTGTETRDPERSIQHLQQYESYLIFRYLENLKPGGNGGGWVDTGGMRYIDRYAEQLALTLFAKAPEITLFDYRQLQREIRPADRASWQNGQTSFDFESMTKPFTASDGSTVTPTIVARAAGITFQTIDPVIGKLGTPLGIKSYKPFNSNGEDFLQNYFGMIGLPMDIIPQFPDDPGMILLTESAKFDPDLVGKIKSRLRSGRNVAITSGLLRSLQGKGIEDIVELECSDSKALVRDYMLGWRTTCRAQNAILIPQIRYFTNDSWEDISAYAGSTGWPILHQAKYGSGYLFVLTVPDNFSDLYELPDDALNRLRAVLSQSMNVHIEGPAKIALFTYDNGTCVVESFLPEGADIKIIVSGDRHTLSDLVTGGEITGKDVKPAPIWGRNDEPATGFDIRLQPHSYRAFRVK